MKSPFIGFWIVSVSCYKVVEATTVLPISVFPEVTLPMLGELELSMYTSTNVVSDMQQWFSVIGLNQAIFVLEMILHSGDALAWRVILRSVYNVDIDQEANLASILSKAMQLEEGYFSRRGILPIGSRLMGYDFSKKANIVAHEIYTFIMNSGESEAVVYPNGEVLVSLVAKLYSKWDSISALNRITMWLNGATDVGIIEPVVVRSVAEPLVASPSVRELLQSPPLSSDVEVVLNTRLHTLSAVARYLPYNSLTNPIVVGDLLNDREYVLRIIQELVVNLLRGDGALCLKLLEGGLAGITPVLDFGAKFNEVFGSRILACMYSEDADARVDTYTQLLVDQFFAAKRAASDL